MDVKVQQINAAEYLDEKECYVMRSTAACLNISLYGNIASSGGQGSCLDDCIMINLSHEAS